MPAGTTGAATIRHVGLVALEALLVAIIVWVTTMALAGASQADGLIGSATAGGPVRGLSVARDPSSGGTVVSVDPTATADWLHVSCRGSVSRGAPTVGAQWIRIGSDHRVSVAFPSVTRPAACVAEQGYFSANGKWRVLATTTFTIEG